MDIESSRSIVEVSYSLSVSTDESNHNDSPLQLYSPSGIVGFYFEIDKTARYCLKFHLGADSLKYNFGKVGESLIANNLFILFKERFEHFLDEYPNQGFKHIFSKENLNVDDSIAIFCSVRVEFMCIINKSDTYDYNAKTLDTLNKKLYKHIVKQKVEIIRYVSSQIENILFFKFKQVT